MAKKKQTAGCKNNSVHASKCIGWSIAVSVLMSGTVWYTFSQINMFSMILVLFYVLLLTATIVLGIYSMMNDGHQSGKWCLILFTGLVIIFAVYVFVYLFQFLDIRLNGAFSNISQSKGG